MAVALGDLDDETQVGLDHVVLGGEVAALDALGQCDLLARAEQRPAAGRPQQQLGGVGRGVGVRARLGASRLALDAGDLQTGGAVLVGHGGHASGLLPVLDGVPVGGRPGRRRRGAEHAAPDVRGAAAEFLGDAAEAGDARSCSLSRMPRWRRRSRSKPARIAASASSSESSASLSRCGSAPGGAVPRGGRAATVRSGARSACGRVRSSISIRGRGGPAVPGVSRSPARHASSPKVRRTRSRAARDAAPRSARPVGPPSITDARS